MSQKELDDILQRLSDPNQKKKFEILQMELDPLLFETKIKIDVPGRIEMLIRGNQNESDDDTSGSDSSDDSDEKVNDKKKKKFKFPGLC